MDTITCCRRLRAFKLTYFPNSVQCLVSARYLHKIAWRVYCDCQMLFFVFVHNSHVLNWNVAYMLSLRGKGSTVQILCDKIILIISNVVCKVSSSVKRLGENTEPRRELSNNVWGAMSQALLNECPMHQFQLFQLFPIPPVRTCVSWAGILYINVGPGVLFLGGELGDGRLGGWVVGLVWGTAGFDWSISLRPATITLRQSWHA